MSQAKNNITRQKTYLQRTRLKGFRTIQDIEIDFDDGLNVIIGKNGTGKSNFLKFLYAAMSLSLEALPQTRAFLVYFRKGLEALSIEIEKNLEAIIKNGTANGKSSPISYKIFKDETLQHQAIHAEDVYAFMDSHRLSFSPVFISHGIPADYYLADKSFSFNIDRAGFIDKYPGLISDPVHSYFLKGMIHFIFLESLTLFEKTKSPTRNQIEAVLSRAFQLLEPTGRILEIFDIKGLRINKNYNVVFDRKRKEFSVSNLFLEFKVDRQWLPFSHLSDGTRRLFYIVSEIFFPGVFKYRKNRFELESQETNKIILIEEPELGLHPAQLDSLLDVLKQASAEHQIIITTHAPQLLDILGKEDLNKIIIARLSKDGTLLRHLTQKERTKAGLYMEEEAFLSDYWRFSDLEG